MKIFLLITLVIMVETVPAQSKVVSSKSDTLNTANPKTTGVS
jgi:hypothetical protein